VTTQGQRAAQLWQDREFASAWTASDTFGDLLALPRAIAAALVGQDRPDTRLVVDVASGPGAFLAAFLDRFPAAAGVWSDASEAMLELARERLAPYGSRVSYRLGDMTDLAAAGLPAGADVVLTSRAAHHLDAPGLAAFYTEAAGHLAPGGWLINLDHIGPSDVWDSRFRGIRPAFAPPRSGEPTHHHNYPLASIADHLRGFTAAGIEDLDIAWKAFYTCLFTGRRAG
jgi:trans-aconitate methyltransferase